jgi:ribose transport system substrate-binding protein
VKTTSMRTSLASFVLVAALVAAGCGGTSEKAAKPAAAGSQELHATVFDDHMPDGGASDKAVTVDVGNGHKVSFDDGERIKVAFIGFGKGYDYTKPEYEAAVTEAKKLGFDYDVFDPKADAQTQLSQVQTVMSSGKYNALVVYPLATDLLCDVLSDKAPAKGLLVVAIGYPACATGKGTPGLLTEIPDTMPSQGTAEAWADGIVKQAGGEPQKALILRGPDYDPNSNVAEEVFKQRFPAAGIDIVDSLETDFTQPGALKVIQDGLQSHRDTTMIVSTFPEGGAAAATALRQANDDEVTLVGYGADSNSIDPLKSGTMKLTVPFYPYTNVKAAYQALALARSGEKVQPFYEYAGHKAEALRAAGGKILLVTPKNVAEYAKSVQEY